MLSWAAVRAERGVCWGSLVMLFAHLMPALVWLCSADTATLQELRSSNAGLELIHFLGSCNSHNV